MSEISQSRLINTNDSNTVTKSETFFEIYYKSVSTEDTKSENKFTDKNEISLIKVMKSLPQSNILDFENLKLTSNRKTWINSLLQKIDKNDINYLLNDFADEMNTNMRGKDKYAILIIKNNELILLHTKMGEKSLSPNFKLFDRMLDKDNIMRYVWFKQEEDNINVNYYEKYQSKFFTEWLGVHRKDLVYEFGGENKFYLDLYGYPLVLEIDDEDFEDNEFFEFENNGINLKEPIETFKINHIKRSTKTYKNTSEFKKDHISRRFNLKHYQKEYKKLMNSLDPIQYKIYDYETCVKTTDKKYHFKKTNDNLFILFCNNKIDIDDNFLDGIIFSLLNNGQVEICHAGMDSISNPLEIKNFKIYNKLNLNLASPLIKHYKRLIYLIHLKKYYYIQYSIVYMKKTIIMYMPTFLKNV